MRHFWGFSNTVYDSWHIRKMHENLMKNTNRKVVDHVFKNTLKCAAAADKNKETKAAPKLRRQARWVYNPRKNSKWVENGLTAAACWYWLQSWEEVEPSEQLSWRKPSGTHGNFNLNCCTFSLEIACEIFLSVADDTTRLRNHCHGRIFNSPGLKSAVTVKGCLIKVATSYKIEVPF